MNSNDNTQPQTKGQLLYQMSRQMSKFSIGDILRVKGFIDAIETQKTGKREQRQEKIRKFNEGLGSK